MRQKLRTLQKLDSNQHVGMFARALRMKFSVTGAPAAEIHCDVHHVESIIASLRTL